MKLQADQFDAASKYLIIHAIENNARRLPSRIAYRTRYVAS